MFSFLGFIFIFVFAVILLVFAIIGKITRTIFGIGRRVTSSQKSNKQYSEEYAQNQSTNGSKSKGHKKVFDKDEGEYVEFEEIKEE